MDRAGWRRLEAAAARGRSYAERVLGLQKGGAGGGGGGGGRVSGRLGLGLGCFPFPHVAIGSGRGSHQPHLTPGPSPQACRPPLHPCSRKWLSFLHWFNLVWLSLLWAATPIRPSFIPPSLTWFGLFWAGIYNPLPSFPLPPAVPAARRPQPSGPGQRRGSRRQCRVHELRRGRRRGRRRRWWWLWGSWRWRL